MLSSRTGNVLRQFLNLPTDIGFRFEPRKADSTGFHPMINYLWTLVTISLSWEIPALTKILALVGIRMLVTRINAFIFSVPKEGGVSIKTES